MSLFYKRTLCCFLALICCFVLCGARIFVIATDEQLSLAAAKQSTRVKTVGTVRGNIYDINGVPFTNLTTSKITAVMPTEKGALALGKILDATELEQALNSLRNGTIYLTEREVPFQSGSVQTIETYKRYSNTLNHVIGYVDSTGHGVYGIEKGFDDLLYTNGQINISYTTDSNGKMIEGLGWSVSIPENDNNVTLTIDSSLQTIAELSFGDGAGSVIIMDAASGEMRAVVSYPSFEADNLADSLQSDDSPFINRALCSYNVGSVFKPAIAAAAIESGMGDYKYCCTGSAVIEGRTFRCNSAAGHGEIDLETALAKSCNTYFYTLALKLSAQKVYDMASQFKLDSEIDLGGSVVSATGNLPSIERIKESDSALANLSIGQGELMVTPVAICNLYSAILNGGKYYLPTIVKKYQKDGKTVEFGTRPPTVVFKVKTAEILKQELKTALKTGTGSSAYVEGIEAGGKTGTAQTGWKDGDRNILNGWFCGFYEGKGKYVIVVLKEDVSSGSYDCAPVFKQIISSMASFGF